MDSSALVSSAQALTVDLDHTKVKPRAVMWVHQPDTDSWRLWIVPDVSVTDKREFYKIVAETISRSDGVTGTMDVGSTEFVNDNHPAIRGLGKFMHMTGIGAVNFSGNMFNGVYLPDGIVIRMNV